MVHIVPWITNLKVDKCFGVYFLINTIWNVNVEMFDLSCFMCMYLNVEIYLRV